MSFLLPPLCKILFATMLTVPPASPLPAPEPTPTIFVICAMPSIAAAYMRKSRMKEKIAESASAKKVFS